MSHRAVVSLRFRLKHGPHVDYDSAPELRYETETFFVTLNAPSKSAVFNFKQPCANESVALEAIQPWVAKWQFYIDLERGPDDLCFEYDGPEEAEVPQEAEVVTGIRNVVQRTVCTRVGGAIHASRDSFLPPPTRLALSPDAEVMLLRLRLYREHRDQLASTAYFVLTVLQESTCDQVNSKETKRVPGKRKAAAAKYRIDLEVLQRLGDLSSTRGGPKQGRKAPPGSPYRPEERVWVEACLKAIIRRVTEYTADPAAPLEQITLDCFPRL